MKSPITSLTTLSTGPATTATTSTTVTPSINTFSQPSSQHQQYQQQPPLSQQQQQHLPPYHHQQQHEQQHIQSTQLSRYPDDDDEMDQVATSNMVDYNTNDSKYMYDDYMDENDYIATGDIVTTSTVTPILNTQSHYTNSYGTTDTDPILDDPYATSGQLPDIPITQTTLTNHKTNLYCDNSAYDLIDAQHHNDDENNEDDSHKIGNNNYLSDHMYNDRYLDTSGNIIFDQNQPVSTWL